MLQIVNFSLEIRRPGKIPPGMSVQTSLPPWENPENCISKCQSCSDSGVYHSGTTEIPFEIPFKPIAGQTLHETYHGVFVNIQVHLHPLYEGRFIALPWFLGGALSQKTVVSTPPHHFHAVQCKGGHEEIGIQQRFEQVAGVYRGSARQSNRIGQGGCLHHLSNVRRAVEQLMPA